MAENNTERRFVVDCELRAVGDAGKPPNRIEGYAARFNSPTELWKGYYEQIAPGAFSRAIGEGEDKAQDIRATFNHDPNIVLGRTTAGTLKLRETKQGLRMIAWPPDTQWGRDLLTSIGRGDVTQQSFTFIAKGEENKVAPDGTTMRTLVDVDLKDVGPVTYPAYLDTTVAARNYEQRTGSKPPVRTEATMPDDTVDVSVVGDPKTESGPDPTTLRMSARTRELMADQQERDADSE